jgi:hypothetical protein
MALDALSFTDFASISPSLQYCAARHHSRVKNSHIPARALGQKKGHWAKKHAP